MALFPKIMVIKGLISCSEIARNEQRYQLIMEGKPENRRHSANFVLTLISPSQSGQDGRITAPPILIQYS